jgi:hypothetical protein
MAATVRYVLDSKEGIASAAASLSRLFEIPGSAEFLGRLETEVERSAAAGQRDMPTDRRLRPFARRRFRTRRPFFVAMRARNPWVRLRLTLLGWYVRFMAAALNLQ